MKAVVVGPRPPELDTFNLGVRDNCRVPDIGQHRELPGTAFVASAALVIEVVSPGDESYDKFDFYADHNVCEVLIAEPTAGTLSLFVLDGGGYHHGRTQRSARRRRRTTCGRRPVAELM